LRTFLTTLIKTTSTNTRFLFTSRYLFDLDAKRVGAIQAVPLHDLSRPEALGLMQKLPHLSAAGYDEKLRAFETFGGHPYALVTLDRHCGHKPLAEVLKDAAEVHAELREFIAIELSYAKLSERSRELLNRLAAFRKPVPFAAAEWVMGTKVAGAKAVAGALLKQLDRAAMPEEMQDMSEAELLNLLQKMLPEQRHAENIDQPITELISWGLLTPLEEDGEVNGLAVHSLVRDFCRDKLKDGMWREYLLDAAAYYTSQTKLLRQDDKTPAAVWMEMEAFELIMEAEDYENAASLLIDASPLLDRWGFGRYLESLHNRILSKVGKATQAGLIHNFGIVLQDRGDYDAALGYYEKSLKILEELGNRAGVATSLHQIGMIHQARGDYDAALAHYEKSLKIAEELGDRAGVASSLHQIGNLHYLRGDYDAALAQYEKSLKILEELGNRDGVANSYGQVGLLFMQTKKFPAAFENLFSALSIFAQLQSPYARNAINALKDLRQKWGAKKFDAAWREKTGEEVPEWLKQSD
jgi:tetratricopeptide (TPR) repeat protein